MHNLICFALCSGDDFKWGEKGKSVLEGHVARRVMGCFHGAVALLIIFLLLILLLFSGKVLAETFKKKISHKEGESDRKAE